MTWVLSAAAARGGAPPPRGTLHDRAAGGDDPAGRPIDDDLALVVGDVRADDEHEFVAAHTRKTPSNGVAPLTVDRHGAVRTEREPRTSKAEVSPPARVCGGVIVS